MRKILLLIVLIEVCYLIACADFPEIPLVSPEKSPIADQGDPGFEPSGEVPSDQEEEGVESEAGEKVPGRSGSPDQDQEKNQDQDQNEDENQENEEAAVEETAEEAAGEADEEEIPEIIIINELYYDAPGSDTDGMLFVELYGTPGMDLTGYQILFVNGGNGTVTDIIELPEGSTVYEDGFFVIADGRTGALDTTQVAVYDFIDNFDPQNGPDGVQLLSPQGDLLDTVVYGEGAVPLAENDLPLGEGSFAADVAGGHSLSRYPAGFDTDDNAIDFVENSTPSPGSGEVLDETP